MSLFQQLIDRIIDARDELDDHVKRMNQFSKDSLAGRRTTIGTPIRRQYSDGVLSAIEQDMNRDWGNGKIPLYLSKLYMNDAAKVFAIIHATPITSKWQKRKEYLSRVTSWSNTPNFVLSGTYKKEILSDLGNTSGANLLRPLGFLTVGYEFISEGPISEYKQRYNTTTPYFAYIWGHTLKDKGVTDRMTGYYYNDAYPFFGITKEGSDKILNYTRRYIGKKYKLKNYISKPSKSKVKV